MRAEQLFNISSVPNRSPKWLQYNIEGGGVPYGDDDYERDRIEERGQNLASSSSASLTSDHEQQLAKGRQEVQQELLCW